MKEEKNLKRKGSKSSSKHEGDKGKEKSSKHTSSKKSIKHPSKKSDSIAPSKDDIPSENNPTERSRSQHDSFILPPPVRDDIPDPALNLPRQRVCRLHNLPILYYCETCEIPVCEICCNSGPHNTELHRISSFMEAFNLRCNYLEKGTYKMLMEKKDRLMGQMNKIDYRIGEIKSVTSIIERDIKTEYGGIKDRLKSSEGTKLAILQHEMATIQKDIEFIDSILYKIDNYISGELREDIVGFLISFKELHEYIEVSIAKPFKTNIEVNTNDLPKEIVERKNTLEKAEKTNSLLNLKDEIIWNLIQEKKKYSKIAERDFQNAVQQEWNEWAKLIERYSDELIKYKLICSYCGCSLDEITVNSVCHGNCEEGKFSLLYKDKLPRSQKFFTIDKPPYEFLGTGRHYFGKPAKKDGLPSSMTMRLISDPRATIALNSIKQSDNEKIFELKKKIAKKDITHSENISLTMTYYDKQICQI